MASISQIKVTGSWRARRVEQGVRAAVRDLRRRKSEGARPTSTQDRPARGSERQSRSTCRARSSVLHPGARGCGGAVRQPAWAGEQPAQGARQGTRGDLEPRRPRIVLPLPHRRRWSAAERGDGRLNTLSVALRYGAKREERACRWSSTRPRGSICAACGSSPSRPPCSRRADARELRRFSSTCRRNITTCCCSRSRARCAGRDRFAKDGPMVESDRCVWVRARKHPDPAIKGTTMGWCRCSVPRGPFSSGRSAAPAQI